MMGAGCRSRSAAATKQIRSGSVGWKGGDLRPGRDSMPKRSFLLSAFVFATVLGNVRAQAEARPVPWQDLPQQVAGRLIAREELGIAGCPSDIALRQPSRRVLQYIE